MSFRATVPALYLWGFIRLPCIRASWIFLFCSAVQSSTTVAQLSSLLGARDIEGWQLPIDRRVSYAFLAGFLMSHLWFRLLASIPGLPAFVGVVIIIIITASLLASGTACTTCTWAAALAVHRLRH